MLLLTALVAGIGFILGVGFGFFGWELCCSIVAFALWTGGVMMMSVVLTLKELRHGKLVKRIDGEEKFYVTLKLGCFACHLEIPAEKKMTSKEEIRERSVLQ